MTAKLHFSWAQTLGRIFADVTDELPVELLHGQVCER